MRGANETSVLDKINSFALISNCSAGEGHVSTDASCARESEQHNNDVNDLTPPTPQDYCWEDCLSGKKRLKLINLIKFEYDVYLESNSKFLTVGPKVNSDLF